MKIASDLSLPEIWKTVERLEKAFCCLSGALPFVWGEFRNSIKFAKFAVEPIPGGAGVEEEEI